MYRRFPKTAFAITVTNGHELSVVASKITGAVTSGAIKVSNSMKPVVTESNTVQGDRVGQTCADGTF